MVTFWYITSTRIFLKYDSNHSGPGQSMMNGCTESVTEIQRSWAHSEWQMLVCHDRHKVTTADALSRVSLPAKAREAELDQEKECKTYLDSIEHLQPILTKLEQIKSAQTSDNACKRFSQYIAKGWHEPRQDVHELLLFYWSKMSQDLAFNRDFKISRYQQMPT